jgi:rubrerythrin
MSEHDPTEYEVSFGETIFDADGRRLGRIRAVDEHGFYVTAEEGIEAMSEEHRKAGLSGEATLMWRCWECGEMGKIAEIPESCPSCGAAKEEIYYWEED